MQTEPLLIQSPCSAPVLWCSVEHPHRLCGYTWAAPGRLKPEKRVPQFVRQMRYNPRLMCLYINPCHGREWHSPPWLCSDNTLSKLCKVFSDASYCSLNSSLCSCSAFLPSEICKVLSSSLFRASRIQCSRRLRKNNPKL